MITYKMGSYTETCDGRVFEVRDARKYDSDAQAELNAKRLAAHNGLDGITIRRAGAEWYVTAAANV